MELKRFWVRNYKSLKDVAIELPTRVTAVTGPSGSGKTALVEAFEMLQNAHHSYATVGVEIWHQKCRTIYELSDKKALMSSCGSDEAEKTVQEFLNGIAVIKDIDWKAVRSLRPRGFQPAGKEVRLLPDASNLLPFLYNITGGEVPDSLIEAVRYAMPSANDLKLVANGGALLLKLATEDGTTMTQATMPTGVLKMLIVEAALMTSPSMVVIDNFECGLDAETQQFLMDELRSHGTYSIIITNSETVLDYVKTPKEVVMLRLVNGETKAWRLGDEVEEVLRKHKLTLSELIGSGLLEPLVF
jgi:predicted ATPase